MSTTYLPLPRGDEIVEMKMQVDMNVEKDTGKTGGIPYVHLSRTVVG